MPEFSLAVEVCEDLWVPDAPSVGHALAGATLIANPSASDETIGKAAYRELLLASQSARLICGYLYADAGQGESTTDMVFAGHNLIAENGVLLKQSEPYRTGLVTAELDLQYLVSERLRMNTFGFREDTHAKVPFVTAFWETPVERFIDPAPFVPSDRAERDCAASRFSRFRKRPRPAAAAHWLQIGGGGRIRRAGFHAGADCRGPGLPPPGPCNGRPGRGHDACFGTTSRTPPTR